MHDTHLSLPLSHPSRPTPLCRLSRLSAHRRLVRSRAAQTIRSPPSATAAQPPPRVADTAAPGTLPLPLPLPRLRPPPWPPKSAGDAFVLGVGMASTEKTRLLPTGSMSSSDSFSTGPSLSLPRPLPCPVLYCTRGVFLTTLLLPRSSALATLSAPDKPREYASLEMAERSRGCDDLRTSLRVLLCRLMCRARLASQSCCAECSALSVVALHSCAGCAGARDALRVQAPWDDLGCTLPPPPPHACTQGV